MSHAMDIVVRTGIDDWDSYIFLHTRTDLVRLDPAIPDEVK